MISFESLSVRYPGAAALAVNGASLAAPRGRLTAVVGPNGSGKSTLLRALLRRVAPAGGSVQLDGLDVSTLSPLELARRVAVVVQREEPVFPLRVREFVALGRTPHRSLWSTEGAEDRALVDAAMHTCGVEEFAARSTDSLSGGEWQRVRIARALAQHAPSVALDEPTTFLDVAHEMAIFELLASLAQEGRAVLVVSHQLNLVARFAAHVVLMHHGRVAAHGNAAEVMQGAVLEKVYEWPLVVSHDPAIGAPTLVPLRRRASRAF
jgi:iron complex transport system ATP-binding protein